MHLLPHKKEFIIIHPRIPARSAGSPFNDRFQRLDSQRPDFINRWFAHCYLSGLIGPWNSGAGVEVSLKTSPEKAIAHHPDRRRCTSTISVSSPRDIHQ